MRFALFAWFARAVLLAGIAKAATGKSRNECKTLGHLGLVCVEKLEHKCSFPNKHFFILVIRNKKGSQALTVKPATAFPEIVYITVTLSYVFDSNCSLNHRNLWLLFFRWFPHGKSAACIRTTRLKYSKKSGIFFWFYVLGIIHFPFDLRHTKTIENINVCKRTEAGPMKKELWSRSCHFYDGSTALTKTTTNR